MMRNPAGALECRYLKQNVDAEMAKMGTEPVGIVHGDYRSEPRARIPGATRTHTRTHARVYPDTRARIPGHTRTYTRTHAHPAPARTVLYPASCV